MHKKTVYIVQKFPNFEEKIDFLFQFNEDFRDLCTDYLLCRDMVLQRQNDSTINNEEFAEMEALQRDVEEEILKEILKEKSTS